MSLMNRTLKTIATLSLIAWRHPVIAGGMLIGVGGGLAIFTPPSILPRASESFNESNASGFTTNALKPNGGTAGAFEFKTDAAASGTLYGEFFINPNLTNNSFQAETPVSSLNLTANGGWGLPTINVARGALIGNGGVWWQAWSPTNNTGSTAGVTGSPANYNTGYYPFTASAASGSCIAPPAGVWLGNSTGFQLTTNGFGCSGQSTVNFAAVPGAGAKQATTTTTCSGAVVTTNVGVSSGLGLGSTFTLSGYSGGTWASLNGLTYTALQGTGGTVLVGSSASLASCPTGTVVEGFALSGVNATLNFTAQPTASIPWNGATGISTKPGQHICLMVGENGDDSQFPGTAFVSATDDKGVALPGSPALVQGSNMAVAAMTGYTTIGSQLLTVTGMPAASITAATQTAFGGGANPNGTIHFTLSAAPLAIQPGSQFSVSGLTSANGVTVNGTYVALANTTGTDVYGNQLTAPAGLLQPLAATGAITPSSAQMTSVIVPGMQVLGGDFQTGVIILPYGTVIGGTPTTGTGSNGSSGSPVTYALSFSQAAITLGSSTIASGASTLAAASPPFGQSLAPGMNVVIGSYSGQITQFGNTGIGQAGNYTVSPSNAGSTQTAAVTISGLWTSGAPGTIYAYSGFYKLGTSPGIASSANVAFTTQSTGTIGDMFAQPIGNSAIALGTNNAGFGGGAANLAWLYGPPPLIGSAPSTAALSAVCKKTQTIPQFAAANGMTLNSYFPLDDIGINGDGSLDNNFTGTITSGALAISVNPPATPFPNGTVISGSGIAGCPATCPTVTANSGASNYTLSGGGTVGPEFMKAGLWKPAIPVAAANLVGSIDGTPPTTLHVTGFPTSVASSGSSAFTGTLSNEFTGSMTTGGVLTIPTPTLGQGIVGINSIVNSAPGAATLFGPCTITSSVTPTTWNTTCTPGTAIGSELIDATGVLPSGPTTLNVTGASEALVKGMIITDGGNSISNAFPLLITSGSGTKWTVNSNYYQAIVADANMIGSLNTIVPGEYIQGAGITNPVKVIGYGPGPGASSCPSVTLGGIGCYLLSTGANGGPIPSSGTQAFTGTSITDGGVIAAGQALTVKDQGPNVTFVVDPGQTTGHIYLSGTYDATLGTPSGIQIFVSQVGANGAAISGCTPCNWGAMTATISGGLWSGNIAGIPAGGQYSVTVRAANATTYATLPSTVKVGYVFDFWGEGQIGILTESTSWSYYTNLWGLSQWRTALNGNGGNGLYTTGPPISSYFAPSQVVSATGDALSASAYPEGLGTWGQSLSNSLSGYPVSLINVSRDGVGITPFTMGYASQTQTIGIGTGSATSFCSRAVFCLGTATVGLSGPLTFSAASLTGGWFQASVTSSGSVSSLTIGTSGRIGGALMPGQVLSGVGITGTPHLVACNPCGATGVYGNSSTWTLDVDIAHSGPIPSSGTEFMRADVPGGSPWPNFDVQLTGSQSCCNSGFGVLLMQAGTFKVTQTLAGVTTTLCQDSNSTAFPAPPGVSTPSNFVYNQINGNCVGATVSSASENYASGDYQVTFSTAPPSGAVLTASYTNIVSPEGNLSPPFNHPTGIDFVGNGDPASGAISSAFAKAPGGISGHVMSWPSSDTVYLNASGAVQSGYQFGGVGSTQELSYLLGTRYPAAFPTVSAQTPLIQTGAWRSEGPLIFNLISGYQTNGSFEQWAEDLTTKSTFPGTVTPAGLLTLSADSVGPMWEGEILGGPVLGSGTGIFILNLCAGPTGPCPAASSAGIGKNGSTYAVSGASSLTGSVTDSFFNDAYYKVAGAPTIYAGPLNDVTVQQLSGLAGTTSASPHGWIGEAAGGRVGRRFASLMYGGLSTPANSSDPTVDRTPISGACDTVAKSSPCIDVGTGFTGGPYASVVPNGGVTSIATVNGRAVMTLNGLAANTIPIAPGSAVFCSSGCGGGLFVISVSNPPTQSNVAGQGQIGSANNGWTVTLNTTLGASTAQQFNFGCFGTATSGGTPGQSNCIDIAIQQNTTNGTFATAWSIANCGANVLNGNAPNYVVPFGQCHDNGIGEITRAVRIGTSQAMAAGATGSVFDDGVDLAGGAFNQNAAFTCNIATVKVVRCVHGPTQSAGVYSFASWTVGSAFVSYGDMIIVSGRIASVLGYVGGQSFPITSAGSGYTNGIQSVQATGCTPIASGGYAPWFDITIAGGAVVDVYPAAAPHSSQQPTGLGVGATTTPCSVAPTGSGSGAVIAAIVLAPPEGAGGIATFSTDNNTMGTLLYGNEGENGNPLNSFFKNTMGGYFEPGNAVQPFGQFQGLAVGG